MAAVVVIRVSDAAGRRGRSEVGGAVQKRLWARLRVVGHATAHYAALVCRRGGDDDIEACHAVAEVEQILARPFQQFLAVASHVLGVALAGISNEDVERDIQAVQWGGRPGLNIRKGNLFGSLILSARRAFGRLVFGDVENHDATYWWYHDKSGLNGAVFTRDTVFGRPVTPFQTFLPVRTDLFGRFETAGMGFYEARAAAALGRTFG